MQLAPMNQHTAEITTVVEIHDIQLQTKTAHSLLALKGTLIVYFFIRGYLLLACNFTFANASSLPSLATSTTFRRPGVVTQVEHRNPAGAIQTFFLPIINTFQSTLVLYSIHRLLAF